MQQSDRPSSALLGRVLHPSWGVDPPLKTANASPGGHDKMLPGTNMRQGWKVPLGTGLPVTNFRDTRRRPRNATLPRFTNVDAVRSGALRLANAPGATGWLLRLKSVTPNSRAAVGRGTFRSDIPAFPIAAAGLIYRLSEPVLDDRLRPVFNLLGTFLCIRRRPVDRAHGR
jgi:hypothetical protein